MTSKVLEEFKNDDVYSAFLKEDFNAKVHASQLVQDEIISDYLKKLCFAITKLEKEIEDQVGDHYEDLLTQASGVEILEEVLQTMHARIQTLQAGVERLRGRIVTPYEHLNHETILLRRLQGACDLLRKVIRTLALTERLKEQLKGGVKDMNKAATSLKEIEDISQSTDLEGIDILTKEQRFCRSARGEVEDMAASAMEHGMTARNMSQVGNALQVYHNLGLLESNISKILDAHVSQVMQNAKNALDVNYLAQITQQTKKATPSPGGVLAHPGGPSSAQFRSHLWAALDRLAETICNVIARTSHLQKVLTKKRVTSTGCGLYLSEVLGPKGDALGLVWQGVTDALREQFQEAAKGSSYLRQALEVDYPKLVRLYSELWKRLEPQLTPGGWNPENEPLDPQDYDTQGATGATKEELMLRASLKPLEEAYIKRSLSRLTDHVNLMFTPEGRDGVPSQGEIDAFVKTITSELNVSALDVRLNTTICENVLKTVRLFNQKTQETFHTYDNSYDNISVYNSYKKHNIGLVNAAIRMHSHLRKMIDVTLVHLSVGDTLKGGLTEIEKLLQWGLEPLLGAWKNDIEKIYFTMALEENALTSDDVSCVPSECPSVSLYMRELQSVMVRIGADFVEQFEHCDIINKSVLDVCAFACERLIAHTAVLERIGEAGKLKLAADFGQLELAVSPLVGRASNIGASFRKVRAIKPLLMLTPLQIMESRAKVTGIPLSTTVNLVYARSKEGSLRHPRFAMEWSTERYLKWIDSHDENEQLLFLLSAVDVIRDKVNKDMTKENADNWRIIHIMREIRDDIHKY